MSGANSNQADMIMNFFMKKVVIFILAVLGAHTVYADGYEIDGEVRYSAMDRASNTISSFRRSFRLHSGSGYQWLIRTEDPDESGGWVKYSQVGSDGTNVYKYSQFSTNQTISFYTEQKNVRAEISKYYEKYASGRTTNGALNTAIGVVYPGQVPTDDFSLAAPVWLACASSGYLAAVTDGKLPIAWEGDHPGTHYPVDMVSAKWSRLSGRPFLPEKIIYFTQDATGRENRFTNAIYRTLSITNWQGLTFPAHFRLERFVRTNESGSPDSGYLLTLVEGRILRIKSDSEARVFIPQIASSTIIADYRAEQMNEGVRVVQYLVTNHSWMDVSQIKNLPAYQHNLKFGKFDVIAVEKSSNHKNNVILLAVFVLTSLIFIFLILKRTKKPNI